MTKRIFKKISQNFCIYLLAALNLIHALQENSYDWLLWTSLFLIALSVLLSIVTAVREERSNG